MIAGRPQRDVPLPAPVVGLVGGRQARVVWQNGLDGLHGDTCAPNVTELDKAGGV